MGPASGNRVSLEMDKADYLITLPDGLSGSALASSIIAIEGE
jgi:hypothetical protein